MFINAINNMRFLNFGSKNNIDIKTISPQIIDQLAASGKYILSAAEDGDTLEITQGDNVTKFVTTFVDGKKVKQEDFYNGNPAVTTYFDEDGNPIIKEGQKK